METFEDKLKNLIKKALKNLDLPKVDVSLEHPVDLSMGDYSTNVAMVLTGKAEKNPARNAYGKAVAGGPKDLAEEIAEEISKSKAEELEKVSAKNGFINFYLTPEFFFEEVREILERPAYGENEKFEGQKVMVEHTQPNPFKPFHIGHLMSNAIGESIGRIIEFSGAKVVWANYQGDVGPHVAKAIWGLMQDEKKTEEMMEGASVNSAVSYIGECYVLGANAYQDDEEKKAEINKINKMIYEPVDSEEYEKVKKIYDWGLEKTLEAFDEIYEMLGTKFDHYFFESEMAPIGKEIISEHPEIFIESDGAVVFRAEEHDESLHTRVFINSQGFATYEAKELGLTTTKFTKEDDLDLSLTTTAVEQKEYMRVVYKAVEIMFPEIGKKLRHITHGMMQFAEGKMSSRVGNVITGESLLADARSAVIAKMKEELISDEELESTARAVGVGAVKYSILKQAIGSNIVYDFEKSISFDGDSGPYLQYSYARARSVLARAQELGIKPSFEKTPKTPGELEKILYRFPEVVARSAEEFEPHYIATFLIEISRLFNSFYSSEKIAVEGDDMSPYKLALTQAFSTILKKGLHLLGIQAPERM